MDILGILKNYSGAQELSLSLQSVQDIMTNSKVPRTEKRKTLCMVVEELSDKTFNNKFVAKQIIKVINIKEDVCKEYQNTEAQVQGILGWLPRMEYHRGLLVKAVTNNRKKFGLNI
jgi:hypothetical protein